MILATLTLARCPIYSNGHDTGIIGEFTLRFNTDESCSMQLNDGLFASPKNKTYFPPYDETEQALEQSKSNSSSWEKGEISCYKVGDLLGGSRKRIFELNFDPSYIIDKKKV